MPGLATVGIAKALTAHNHGCPGCCGGPHIGQGPFVKGSPTVICNGKPAVRATDQGVHGACCGAQQSMAQQGSSTVRINNMPAHGGGMATLHCGSMPGTTLENTCSPNVKIAI